MPVLLPVVMPTDDCQQAWQHARVRILHPPVQCSARTAGLAELVPATLKVAQNRQALACLVFLSEAPCAMEA